MPKPSKRYRIGWEQLQEIDGEAGERVIESLRDISPDLGRFVIEYAFGDVYPRPDLNRRQRQLVTIGCLAGMGGCEPQLEVHVNAALNVGLSPGEIVEAIIHTTIFAGFPRALNAMAVAKKVFDDRDLLPIERDQHSPQREEDDE